MSNKSIRFRVKSLREARAEHVLAYITTCEPLGLSLIYYDLEGKEMSREDIDTAVDDLIREGRLEARGTTFAVRLSPVPKE